MDILPEIDLSENRITNNTIDKLIETLKTTKFKKLNLESVFTKNNKQETFEILRKICEVIKESTNLEELIITLDNRRRGLGEGESLSLCKKLQIINLEDNFFTKKTSKMLSRSLANWPDLKQLIINDCLICKKGVIYILEALLKGTNKNIEYLGFQYCSIDENGFYTLASIIKKSLMLKVVEINGNYSIKKKCMSKLNLVSKKNGTLINGFDDLINEDDEGEEKEGKEKEGKEKELDDNEVEEIHNDMKGKGHDGKEGKEEEGLDVEEEEGDYDEKEGKEEEGLDVKEEEGDYDGKEE
ncbi:RNI-like protein [Rhizophagus irregularis DAOM 181602=DAOM 197198]|nr:RNI-like protein [Rhizophagus irregularis DAOM 181602=DAOM 197198]